MKGGLLKMYKKAQGEIITTVLIILLVLAAIVIVWQVVNSTVRSGGEQVQSQSSCLGVSMEITNAEVGNGWAIIRRGPGSSDTKVTGYKVFVKGSDANSTTSGQDIKPLDTVNVTFSTVTLASGDNVESAAVVGNNVCPSTGSYTVK
jgi:hypothetical protein